MSVSRESLVAALRKRSRSVIAHVDGEAIYLLEAAADAITEAGESIRAALAVCEVARLDGYGGPYIAKRLNEVLGQDATETLRRIESRVLSQAADRVYGDERSEGPFSNPLSVASWLRDEADRIATGS